jgi:hypothetical protein
MKPFDRWAIAGATALVLGVLGIIYWQEIGIIAVCMFGGIGCL